MKLLVAAFGGVDMPAPAAAAVAVAVAVADDVILCEGALRPVVAGQVVCPHHDLPVRVEACGDCRLLTWRNEDRLRPSGCSTESTQNG